jgi:hypothetical protein
MDIKTFNKKHRQLSKGLKIFNSAEAMEFASSEKTISIIEVNEIESMLGYNLPRNYIDFCMNFGGGYFGYLAILSLDRNGKWYLGDVLAQLPNYFPTHLVPFCDDQTSGYYCFKIDSGIASEEIYHIDSTGLIMKLYFSNFFDFLLANAYSI